MTKTAVLISYFLSSLISTALAQIPDVGPAGPVWPPQKDEVIIDEPYERYVKEPAYEEPRRAPRKEKRADPSKPPKPLKPPKPSRREIAAREARQFYDQGAEFFYRGDLEEALQWFKKAYRRFPDGPYLAWMNKASIRMAMAAYNNHRSYADAYDILKEALEYDPDNSRLLAELGLVIYLISTADWFDGDYKGSWKKIQRAYQLAPDNLLVRLTYEKMEYKVGVMDEALALQRRGHRAHRRGNNEEAVRLYAAAYKLLPDLSATERGLAQAEVALGRDFLAARNYYQAMKLLTKALKLAPDDRVVRENYANGNRLHAQAWMRSDPEAAILLLEEAVKYDVRYAAKLEEFRASLRREEERKVAEQRDWRTQLEEEDRRIEAIPQRQYPLGPDGAAKALSGWRIDEVDPDKIREIEAWAELRGTNVRANRLAKRRPMRIDNRVARIEWNIPLVMDLMTEKGLLTDYYDKHAGGLTEQREVEAFKAAMRQSIDRVLAQGAVPGSTQVRLRMQAQLRDAAIAAVQKVDDFALRHSAAIGAAKDDLFPLVKFVLAPETVMARSAMFMAGVTIDYLKQRSVSGDSAADSFALALGEPALNELGGQFVKDLALKTGFIADETQAQRFSTAAMQYYLSSKKKQETP